jgi:uncharacterized membrane protein (UPF0136 family)
MIAALAHATDGFSDHVMRTGPASILGLVSGVALLVAAFGLLSGRYWGWKAGLGAHVLAIASTLIAMFSVAGGYGDRASLAVPGALLVLLVLSFFALWRARPRNPLRRAGHEIAAKMY